MKKYNEIIKKYSMKPFRYQLRGKVVVIDTENGSFAIKEKNRNNNQEIFRYLKTRNFEYYPKILNRGEDEYEITQFVEEVEMPSEQKLLDMIDLVALLHLKTTHFKEIDEDDNKKIYEDINNNIEYLMSYYNDLAAIIESKVFMSPSEYLLVRNLSKIFAAIQFSKQQLEYWYTLIKEKRKQRFVVLHNNLRIDHFVRNEGSYLISWDKSKFDLPIFDLFKLYKNHGLEFEFGEILKRYETTYKLLEEERVLLFILIALPDKIELNLEEYEQCVHIGNKIDFIYKAEMMVSPYYAKETKQNK